MGRSSLVEIAFEHHLGGALVVVDTESEALLVPGIVVDSVGVIFVGALETTAKDAEAGVARSRANLQIVDGVVHIAGEGGGLDALGVSGFGGDDVDDAVGGVGSPDGAGGTADDFNTIDVFDG